MVAIKSVTGTQAQNVPASALRKVDEAVNSVTKELIPTGETVKREHLLGQLGSLGVGSLIPPGKRAMMLTLRHQPRVVQLLHPGDRVDVIATFDNEFSRAVLEDIEVMSISEIVKNSAQPQNNANNPPPPPEPLLTVAVTPKEAEALALVADATLNVVLHPKGSVEMPQYSEGTLKKEIMRKLVRDRAPKSPRVYQPPLPRVVIQQPPSLPIRIEPAPSVKAPPTNTVEVIAGGQRKVVEIPAKPQ
jgi:Flp pilus assembly protein CpaB